MIYITEELRIVRLDSLNLTIEEFRDVEKKDGTTKKEWKAEGFYGTLKQALLGAMRRLTFDLTKEDIELKYAISRINDIEEKIEKAFKEKV